MSETTPLAPEEISALAIEADYAEKTDAMVRLTPGFLRRFLIVYNRDREANAALVSALKEVVCLLEVARGHEIDSTDIDPVMKTIIAALRLATAASQDREG